MGKDRTQFQSVPFHPCRKLKTLVAWVYKANFGFKNIV